MKKKKFIKVAKEVIDLEIKALIKLRNNLNDSFNLAVEQILKCQSKVILLNLERYNFLYQIGLCGHQNFLKISELSKEDLV